MVIISSNIRFDNPKDGKNSWSSRREILSGIIRSHSPLILATQEGKKKQLVDFENLLPEMSLVDENRAWIKERMYPSFFIDLKKLQLLDSGDIWLSTTPSVPASSSFGSSFPRLATWIKVYHLESKSNLLVANIHLDHSNEQIRLEQIKVFIAEIKKVHHKEKFILMGDFNTNPDSKVRELINSNFSDLIDPWKSLKLNWYEASHHKFGIQIDYASRIDWTLVDKKIEVLSAFFDKTNSDGIFPSDHYPVVVRLNL